MIIRYAAVKKPDGTWSAYTAIPAGPIDPTNGHQFTNPNVNFGGEHFGVGFRGNPANVRYNWLIEGPNGDLILGPPVQVATPNFVYQPALRRVQAVIEPPEPEEPPVKEFGEASWVREIRTTSHNNNPVKLRDLVSDDPDDPNDVNWRNDEPDEIEIEWHLLQIDYNAGDKGAGRLEAEPEDLNNGDEVVTRRYEFYEYVGPFDLESGEALGDKVAPDDVHGVGVKTAGGVEYDLENTAIVGNFLGAQMSAFDPDSEIQLIDHLQDGERNIPYPDRTVVVAGGAPFTASQTGDLPPGMSFDPVTGILSGTPTAVGEYVVNVEAGEADSPPVTKSYTFKVAEVGAAPPLDSILDTSAFPVGSGTTTGDGAYETGTSATVAATANPGFVFQNWTDNGEVVSNSTNFTFTMDVNHSVIANFAVDASAIAAPDGISATKGTSTTGVSVGWNTVAGAASYHVFRNTTDNSATATEIGTSATTAYEDATAEPAVSYFYWVKADDGSGGTSGHSPADTGYRHLAAPIGLTGSTDNLDAVVLNWSAVTGASGYEVLQGTTNDSTSATAIGNPGGTTFSDASAAEGVDYFYWVRADSAVTGLSELSAIAAGRRPVNTHLIVAGAVVYDPLTQPGRYAGLVQDSEGDTAGRASFRLTHSKRNGTGGLSGVVVIDGRRIELRGTVEADGSFNGRILGRKQADLRADLQIHETATGAKQLLGTIVDTVTGETHIIGATRSAFDKGNQTSLAGQYTMLIPAQGPPQADIPAGDGCGVVTVKTTGAVRSLVYLGDGARVSLSGKLSGDGQWGLYRSLYTSRPRGSISGVLTFRDVIGISDFDGEFHWEKFERTRDRWYPAGFDLDREVVGSAYVRPERDQWPLSGFTGDVDNVSIAINGAGVDQDLTATWQTNNRIVYTRIGVESLGVKVRTKNGLITGTWRESRRGLRVPFRAVVFQKQGIASGNFRIQEGTGVAQLFPK